MADETRDFFVSFNKADRAWAAWVAWIVEEAGWTVWFQDWDFKGNFVLEMDRAHTRSRRTIAILSPDYLTSRFTAPEWAARFREDADSARDLLVPIRVRSCELTGLLAPIIYEDCVDSGEEAAKARILARLRGLRRKPDEPPPFPGRAHPGTAKPDFPLAHHNLPHLTTSFVGREAELAALRQALLAGGRAALTQAITGLGGIGKTQTALAYAHRHLADYRLVWWLHAEQRATLLGDYAGLAEPLGLGEQADQDRQVRAVKAALEARSDWLLVLDNAEEPSAIRELLPAQGGGHVLVTSRWSDWHGTAAEVELQVLPPDDAVRLLTGDLTTTAALHPETAALAEELGRLPLALAHAHAYMRRLKIDVARYRQKLAGARAEVLGWRPRDAAYPSSVAETWQVSIAAAAAEHEGAPFLLEILAFLAPDPLPRTVLTAWPDLLPVSLAATGAVDEALAALAAYSLIGLTAESVAVHRLVQSVAREQLGTDVGERAAAAVALLNAAMTDQPHDHRNWLAMAQLLPHTLRVTSEAEPLAVSLIAVATALNQTAVYLWSRASYAEAEPLFRRAIAIGESQLGPDHPVLATRLNNLALLLQETGRHAEAEPLFRRALTISEGRPSPDHRALTISLDNLANLLYATGRHAEAEPLYRQAVWIGEAQLGANHPDFATSLNNLALLLRETGRHAEAEPLFRRALAISESHSGYDHPDLAISLDNLALLLRDTGRHAEAEPLCRRALAISEARFGPDHPSLAISLNSLALLLRDMCRHAEAELLFRRALAISEARLGPDHPSLATRLNNLALLLRDTGCPSEAELLFLRALAILEGALPPDHPHLAKVSDNLASLLESLDRPDEAATYRAKAAAIRAERKRKGLDGPAS